MEQIHRTIAIGFAFAVLIACGENGWKSPLDATSN
jgi:hypothetical protein